MNEYHKNMKEREEKLKENQQNNTNEGNSANPTKVLKKLNLNTNTKILNRKHQMKMLLTGDPKIISKRLQAQKKVEESKSTPEEIVINL